MYANESLTKKISQFTVKQIGFDSLLGKPIFAG